MTMPDDMPTLAALIADYDAAINLLDIGASGGVYEPFKPALPLGTLVEIDPDARDFPLDEEKTGPSGRIRIRKAITESDTATTVRVYLTRSPYCTSTLKGDFSRLKNFPYTDLFEIVGEEDVAATSLNRLAAELNLEFHWIKLDTQGTELRVLESLAPARRSALCACDAEISFYRHYIGADWLPDFHRFMDAEGFYISDIVNIQSRFRLTAADQARMQGEFPSLTALKPWPTSPELRYLRAFNVGDGITDVPGFVRVWAISFLTENYVYCYFLLERLREWSDEYSSLVNAMRRLLAGVDTAHRIRLAR